MINVQQIKATRVFPNDRVKFRCSGCGECCRNIYQRVPLESLDVYRITNFLRHSDDDIMFTGDFLKKYAEPVILDESGYLFYFIKTKGEDSSCIFLKDNKCVIHKVNPRACRIYPFSAHPNGNEYYICDEKPHHFTGSQIRIRSWMKKYFTEEDRQFVMEDYKAVKQIADLMKAVRQGLHKDAIMMFVRYKYIEYDLDKPFLDQFRLNQRRLIKELKELVA